LIRIDKCAITLTSKMIPDSPPASPAALTVLATPLPVIDPYLRVLHIN